MCTSSAYSVLFLRLRRPPRSTRTDTLFPYTTLVRSPTVEDTVSILRGLKEKYELHHGVRITDAALVAAATLSNRYITDRFLPDKAIDLMDEAASRLRMEVESKPEEIEAPARRIIQRSVEHTSELQSLMRISLAVVSMNTNTKS